MISGVMQDGLGGQRIGWEGGISQNRLLSRDRSNASLTINIMPA
jgi:hypothetical protein